MSFDVTKVSSEVLEKLKRIRSSGNPLAHVSDECILIVLSSYERLTRQESSLEITPEDIAAPELNKPSA